MDFHWGRLKDLLTLAYCPYKAIWAFKKGTWHP